MSAKLTRDAYQRLVDEDLAWLDAQPRTLEREHVRLIVTESVRWEYPTSEMILTGARALHANENKTLTDQVWAVFDAIHNIGRVSP